MAWVLVVVVLGGCGGGAYERLCPECESAQVAEFSSAYAALHSTMTMVETRGARPKGPAVKLAMYELRAEGAESPRPVVVFIHGLFADHSTWRFVVPEFSRDHDVILLDLPGCGKSEAGHDRADDANDVYGIDAMAERVLEVMESRLGSVDPSGPVRLVGHSLGGAVIMRMLGDPAVRGRHAELLGRVDRVVLIAPLDVAVEKADPLFLRLAQVSGPMVGLAASLGLLREEVGAAVYESVGDPQLALREEADKRLEVLTTSHKRRAMQAMIRCATPSREAGTYKPDWDRIEAVVGMYANVAPPPLIVWGGRDETLPVAGGYKIAALVPGSRLEVIPRVKHSPQLEAPGLLIELLRREWGESARLAARASE